MPHWTSDECHEYLEFFLIPNSIINKMDELQTSSAFFLYCIDSVISSIDKDQLISPLRLQIIKDHMNTIDFMNTSFETVMSQLKMSVDNGTLYIPPISSSSSILEEDDYSGEPNCGQISSETTEMHGQKRLPLDDNAVQEDIYLSSPDISLDELAKNTSYTQCAVSKNLFPANDDDVDDNIEEEEDDDDDNDSAPPSTAPSVVEHASSRVHSYLSTLTIDAIVSLMQTSAYAKYTILRTARLILHGSHSEAFRRLLVKTYAARGLTEYAADDDLAGVPRHDVSLLITLANRMTEEIIAIDTGAASASSAGSRLQTRRFDCARNVELFASLRRTGMSGVTKGLERDFCDISESAGIIHLVARSSDSRGSSQTTTSSVSSISDNNFGTLDQVFNSSHLIDSEVSGMCPPLIGCSSEEYLENRIEDMKKLFEAEKELKIGLLAKLQEKLMRKTEMILHEEKMSVNHDAVSARRAAAASEIYRKHVVCPLERSLRLRGEKMRALYKTVYKTQPEGAKDKTTSLSQMRPIGSKNAMFVMKSGNLRAHVPSSFSSLFASSADFVGVPTTPRRSTLSNNQSNRIIRTTNLND